MNSAVLAQKESAEHGISRDVWLSLFMRGVGWRGVDGDSMMGHHERYFSPECWVVVASTPPKEIA